MAENPFHKQYGAQEPQPEAPAFDRDPTPYGTFDDDAPVRQRPVPTIGMAIAALVCGVTALLMCWIPLISVISLVLAILSIIFGARGIRNARIIQEGQGIALTGLITGIISTLISLLVTLVSSLLLWGASEFLASFFRYID